MYVLVVENKPAQGEALRTDLQESGFKVDLEMEGATAFGMARSGNYDAIVLDAAMARLSEFDFVRGLRRFGVPVPIMVIDNQNHFESRVRALDSGADDCLAEPFEFLELQARLRALLRRSPMQGASRLVLDDLQLDLITSKVQRAGQKLELSGKEFAVLSLLMRRKGQIVPRDILADQIWGTSVCRETNVVEVSIRRLRSKIDEPFEVKLLHTVRRMGYVLECRDDRRV